MLSYSAKFSQDKKFYVYEYLRSRKSKNGDAGTPYYVGKGCNNRSTSKQHSVHKPNNKNNILCSTYMNEADSLQSEMLKIHLYGRIDNGTGILRNLTDGGEGTSGTIRSVSTRQKISKSHIGLTHSVETRKILSLVNTGKTLSTEIKQKISLANSGKIFSDEHRKNLAISKKNISKETRKKMSKSQKGKVFSKETREKISKAMMGKTPWNKGLYKT